MCVCVCVCVCVPNVQVVGVLQPNEQPSAVLPDNVPDVLEFHWIDVPAMVGVWVGHWPSYITRNPCTAVMYARG